MLGVRRSPLRSPSGAGTRHPARACEGRARPHRVRAPARRCQPRASARFTRFAPAESPSVFHSFAELADT
ncbi:hypothetical protein GCM10018785_54090 [Streptomyces longispororuber]|uniref:Uncharacterized protein n=1 Tax=Streptomyces longispororuber TaxID=68230 RepID=A0A918ZZZ9_9ACTN|nr:hypothetical protein GCM10018785_54090 [Streptomyces longispororuber]